jgi:hypothetical protein
MLEFMPAADFLGWKTAVSMGLVDLGGSFESQKQDIRTAQIVATVMNLFRKSPIKIDDVVLKWERKDPSEAKKVKTPQEMLVLMRATAMSFMTPEEREQHFG